MTNKKFKVAAMSMALTACVAAQPLIANAADEEINSNDENVNESQSEGESTASVPVAAASESSSNTEVKAEKKQDMLAPDEHLGEYSKPETDTDGNSTSEADITKDAPEQEQEPEIDDGSGDTDGSGDSGDTDGTAGTGGTGDSGDTDGTGGTDNTGSTGSEIKEQIPIGESTLTETPGQSSTVVTPNPGAEPMPDPTNPPKVTTNPDGSTDIETSTVTPGTETTTNTASGEVNAESHTKEETSGDQIDLDTELGETKPDWNTEKDAKFNGYNVDNVEPSDDGNSKTLTLTKTKRLEGQMGSEELAKFTNSTKKDNGDGTYDLVRTETYTDENGQQRTRTTTLHVKDNEVIVDTTITLSVTLEKGKHDVGSGDISHVELPNQIKVTDPETGNTKNISAAELEQLLKLGEATSTTEGTKKTYTVNKDGLEYTIEVDEEASRKLTNAEIAEKLDSSKYKYDKATDKIYYIGKGERAELTEEQNTALRRTLSYTVKVKETTQDGNLSYVDSQTKDEAFKKAETAAKTEARNNAVINALKELKLNDTQVQQALTDGTFDDDAHTFTYTLDGKTYTLNYTIDPTTTESSAPTSNAQGTIDTKEHTVTGTAYVTTGTVSWTDIGSGSGEHSTSSGKPWTEPEGAEFVDRKDVGSGKTITTYKVTSNDGKTVTTYVVTEEEVPLSETEKEQIAWDHLKEDLNLNPDLTPEQLQNMGYSISGVTFTGSTKKISWTATQTTTIKTEKPVSDIIYVDGDKKWTIDEEAGTITVDGTTYTISQKNADSYTCDVIGENNQKTTYTFTEKDDATSLTDSQVRELLVKKLKIDFPDITANDINLNTDGKTASYTKGGTTVTIDYSKLGKKLEVKKDEHHSNSTTVTITDGENADAKFEEACKKLLEDIKTNILPMLNKDKGEELWIGNTHVTKDTTLTTDIMEYFTKAISSADMSNDEIIKALEEQARVAKETDVKVNEGKTDSHGRSYEETLRNYYDGEKEGTYYVKPDGSTYLGYVEWSLSGKPYYYDWDKRSYVELTRKTGQKDKYISHLDLASDSKLDLLPDKEGHVKTTDCVLISKDLKLEWNYKADDLVKDKNNTTVSLKDKITFDSEDGKEGSGHYEYVRGDNYEETLPTKSAYYKLTGTVVYGAVKGSDGNVTKYGSRKAAKKAYCDETGRAYDTVSDEDFAKYVVKVGDKYQVYTKSSQLEAYGYMTRDANTCVNQTYYREYDSFDYCGGYDLMISKLVQVREGKIVGQTESNTKTITAPWSIRTTENKADGWLQLLKKTTTVSESTDFDGSTTNGNYSYTYTLDHADTLGSQVTGTGTGTYTSFRQLLTRIFTGSGQGHEDSGSFRYTYRTENDAVLTPVSKVTEVKKKAHITYDRTTVESRDVLIPGTETVHIDPDDDGGDEIIEEKDPDSPVLPGTPELPPVQDAKPDAPVLPADPALPAVQDAHALPQTGVNWLAAIGLALSGMTLMITGAFASLLGKNAKH